MNFDQLGWGGGFGQQSNPLEFLLGQAAVPGMPRPRMSGATDWGPSVPGPGFSGSDPRTAMPPAAPYSDDQALALADMKAFLEARVAELREAEAKRQASAQQYADLNNERTWGGILNQRENSLDMATGAAAGGTSQALQDMDRDIEAMQQQQWGSTPRGSDFMRRNDLGVIPVGPRAAPGKQRPKLQELRVPAGTGMDGRRLGIEDSPEYQAWLASGAQTPLALRGQTPSTKNQGLSPEFVKRRNDKYAANREENAQRKATAKTLITARAQSRGTPFERLPLPMAAQIINEGLGSADPTTLAMLDPQLAQTRLMEMEVQGRNMRGQVEMTAAENQLLGYAMSALAQGVTIEQLAPFLPPSVLARVGGGGVGAPKKKLDPNIIAAIRGARDREEALDIVGRAPTPEEQELIDQQFPVSHDPAAPSGGYQLPPFKHPWSAPGPGGPANGWSGR